MAFAADIDEAIGLTQFNVETVASDVAASLRTQLELWMNGALAQFDDANVAQRTVRDWKVPTQYLISRLPVAVGQQLGAMSDACLVVYKCTCSAKYAQLAGRITAGQLAVVLAAWNTAWGF
jgi:hypothetical protein